MEQALKLLSVTGAIFVTATLFYNINPRFMRFPFEPFISKFGLQLYIPLFTSLAISIALILFMNFFQTSPLGPK